MPSAGEAPELPAGRSPGWTLTAGPTQAALQMLLRRRHRSSLATPLAIAAGPTPVSWRPFPLGAAGRGAQIHSRRKARGFAGRRRAQAKPPHGKSVSPWVTGKPASALPGSGRLPPRDRPGAGEPTRAA